MKYRAAAAIAVLYAGSVFAGDIELKNSRLSLRFDERTSALVRAETADGLRLFGSDDAPIDIHSDGKWCLSQGRRPERSDVLCLDGQWDFKVEGGPWRTLRVPGFWEEQGITQKTANDPDPDWKPYNGVAYYRTSFSAPAAWRGKPIRLVVHGIDDEDWCSVNGTAVGHTGMDIENWWSATRSYPVPEDILKFDAPNTLDVKVYDRGGDGGIAGSVLIGPAEDMAAQVPCSLKLESHRIDQRDGLIVLAMDCSTPAWRTRTVYELPETGAWIRRRAEWTYVGDGTASVTCVRLNVPRMCIDRAEDCAYTMPTFWPPKDVPFGELVEGQMQRGSSYQAIPAAAVIYNRKHCLGLSATLYTEDEQSGIIVGERDGHIDVHSEAYAVGPMKKGETIRIGDQVIYLTSGTLVQAIESVGTSWNLAGFRPAERPDWTHGAALYSLWAGGSVDSGSRDLGGLQNFRKYLLPRLHKLGVDVVWFNPINPGSYGPTIHRDVDPRHGTLDDLKAVCDDAHGRGMRIWLDLIPHGPQENSPDGQYILKNHPEWVSRDKDGAIKYWWGGLCCDYANPSWQAEIADVAAFFVKRCGIDGWRVDCAQGSPPNERPYDDLRPSQSGLYGALHLLAKVRTELKAAKPDAAILGEAGSISQLTQCDFVYDWAMQHAVLYALPEMAPEQWVPLTKDWLERQQAALPEGAEFGLMRFLENHDQYRSMRRYGVGHERALLSLCSLIPGLVFVFNEQDIGMGRHIERLLHIRHAYDEFRKGRAIYAKTKSSAPSVFAFTRILGDKFSLAAINFSNEDRTVDILVPVDQVPGPDRNVTYSATEVYDGEDMGARPLSEWRTLSLAVPAYGTKVVVFRRAGEPKPAIAKQQEGPKPTAQTPLKISQEGNLVNAENAFYRITLSNGLVKSLADCAGKQLLNSMNIIEGARKIWPGERLNFAESVKATGEVRKENGKTVVTFGGELTRSAEVHVPWEAKYVLDDSQEIAVEFVLHPPKFNRLVCGRLGMELEFGQADEWLVNTIEGQLCDTFAVTHPLGDMQYGYRYWHRSGLLWEASLFPLDNAHPVVGAKVGGTWLDVELPPLLNGFENAYLRERSSAGSEGLTLHLAWLDEKGRADLSKPIRAAFKLRVGREAPKPSGSVSGKGWTFDAESSRYEFRNRHYELAVCRGLGGKILHLSEPGGTSVIASTEVYSDSGVYTPRKNSVGQETRTQGSSKNDFEPDVFLRRTDNGLSLTLDSFLRLSYWNWANVASPRVQYEVLYGLDDSPKIRTRCRVRPMLSDTKLRAFLAQTLHIPHAREWRVDTAAGKKTGNASPAKGQGRVWESREQPLADNGTIAVELLDGRTLRFSALDVPTDQGQSIFLLDGGGNRMILFIAFLDGEVVRYRPSWRAAEYTMELVKP